MRVVLDTNVLVSAFLNSNGVPAKIWKMILKSEIVIVYDYRILDEYIEVLNRDKFGFSMNLVWDVIEMIQNYGDFIVSEECFDRFIDEGDKKFFEVFLGGEVGYLITGNLRHFPQDNKIVTPRRFYELKQKS